VEAARAVMHMKAISCFEANLLRILQCLLQRAPLERALPLLATSADSGRSAHLDDHFCKSLSSPRALHGSRPRDATFSVRLVRATVAQDSGRPLRDGSAAQAICAEALVAAGRPSRKGSASPRELCATVFSTRNFVELRLQLPPRMGEWERFVPAHLFKAATQGRFRKL
jgi:hypothetical protein